MAVLVVYYTGNVTSVPEVRSASARLFANMWRPLVSVITTLDYVATIIFQIFIIVCGIAHFLFIMRVFEVLASSSSLRLDVCQILFLSRPPLLS